jgi:hypothetical protein
VCTAWHIGQRQESARRQILLTALIMRDQTETTQVRERPKRAKAVANAAKIA